MNLGGPEILVILVVAVIVLGPEKLPAALRMFGKAMGEVKKYQDMAKKEIEKAMSVAEANEAVVQHNPAEPGKDEQSAVENEKQTNKSDSVAPILDDE
ncbi:MAG: Sec-independent protein translocase protein TatB [Acidimicrobiia bacterium]